MQHHFSSPTFFLTLTPDDENHMLVQKHSEDIFSSVGATDLMDEDELFSVSRKKRFENKKSKSDVLCYPTHRIGC
jgi:hypothetical protein